MKAKHEKKQRTITVICGFVIGLINGFFGGGGGMLCVPYLEKFCGYQSKHSHATTLCVILPLSLISSFVYLYKNDLNFIELILITVGAVIGAILGAIFLKKINEKWLKVIFATIMLAAGIKMVL